MTLDQRDIWPNDVPLGTFDIERSAIAGYPGASGHMLFVCPNGRRCGFLVGPVSVERPDPVSLYIWGWDGNFTHPTITPSINCISEKDGQPAGGCGWHGFITMGDMK